MLSKEEQNTVDFFKECITKDHLFEEDFTLYNMKILVNLITKLQKENEEKDKQIDLMGEFLGERDLGYYKNETEGEIFGIMRQYNKEDWKKYFERKSE